MTYDSDDIQTGTKTFDDDYDDLEDSKSMCCETVSGKMFEMVNIQNALNCKFVGDDWREKAAQHERIDYLPTILDEAAELMRSNTQWKFWKKPTPPNLSNAKLEFIDMLHFAMSEELSNDQHGELADLVHVAFEMAAGYESAYQTVQSGTGLFPKPADPPAFNFQKHKSALFRYLASVFMYYEMADGCFSEFSEVCIGVGPEPSPVDGVEALDLIGKLDLGELDRYSPRADWSAFWEIALHLGMTFEEIYLTYLGKVCLNELRIEKGDKAGTYLKHWWRGEEDNHFLMSFVQSHLSGTDAGKFNREMVSSWLTQTYNLFEAGGDEPLIEVQK